MTATGLVVNVQRFSVHDGPGVRTTIFMKGCPLACSWCHNPESQQLSPAFVRMQHRCMHCGRCTDDELASSVVFNKSECDIENCPTGALQMIGERTDADFLVRRVLRDRVFFDESLGGVTISGGEPLVQAPFVTEVLRRLKDEGVHTALDTCGFAPWEHLRHAASVSDLILFDLKLMDDRRHEAATGVSNAPILRNLADIAAAHANVWIRIPIVPNVNDDDENLSSTVDHLATLPGISRVDLLPYHPTGEAKFARLGKHYPLHGTRTPSAEHMASIAARFVARGFQTTIGGQAA